MAKFVCPWWLGYFLLNPLRKWVQSPRAVLAPYVTEGMIVLEPGPGMGFFTLELARLVGAQGKVVAVELQEKMIAGLRRRADRAGLRARVEIRRAESSTLKIDDLTGKVDFALLFALVHEVPDPARFFAEIARVLGPGKKALVSEPTGHVSATAFEETLTLAQAAGFAVTSRPQIWRSRSALLTRR